MASLKPLAPTYTLSLSHLLHLQLPWLTRPLASPHRYLYTVENQKQTKLFTYSTGLKVVTSGCDIHFTPGSAPEVKYEAPTSALDVTPYKSGDNKLYALTARNKDGCDGWPRGACAGKCLVTVSVPPEASGTTFVIGQEGTDKTSPKVIVMKNTKLGGISMGADHTKVNECDRLH